MRVLVVCSGNSNSVAPFIIEQVAALRKKDIQIGIFTIRGKGLFGYIRNYFPLLQKIKNFNPEILHAHYGLSGLLACLQRKVPVVLTLHGSDVNLRRVLLFSKLASRLAKFTILVSREMVEIMGIKKKFSIIPCGISLEQSYPLDKISAKEKLGFNINQEYILFSSSFNRPEKNFKLAKRSLTLIDYPPEIIELKGFDREKVTLLLNACDLALLTSISEGSPQFIKEAMACNCPIVSTDVGDVRWLTGDTGGCFIASFEPEDVASKIRLALNYSRENKKTDGRERIIELGLDSEGIVDRIISVYTRVLDKK